MVADFLINQQEDKDSELYQEHEATKKTAAATIYIGGYLMSSYYCVLIGRGFIAGAETVRRNRFRPEAFTQ
jgi:hypothetical protein